MGPGSHLGRGLKHPFFMDSGSGPLKKGSQTSGRHCDFGVWRSPGPLQEGSREGSQDHPRRVPGGSQEGSREGSGTLPGTPKSMDFPYNRKGLDPLGTPYGSWPDQEFGKSYAPALRTCQNPVPGTPKMVIFGTQNGPKRISLFEALIWAYGKRPQIIRCSQGFWPKPSKSGQKGVKK